MSETRKVFVPLSAGRTAILDLPDDFTAEELLHVVKCLDFQAGVISAPPSPAPLAPDAGGAEFVDMGPYVQEREK